MTRILIFLFFTVAFLFQALPPANAQQSQRCRVMFYNTENLFDPFDDSASAYNVFTSSGNMFWTFGKFNRKVSNLYKTILALGEWEPPDLVGLCEIENRFVLNWLVFQTPLKQFNYRVIHHDSPDKRGIDVALLYRKDNIRILYEKAIRINFPFDTAARTRDILYAKLLIHKTDTLHVFVVHLPSKAGGSLVSSPKRNYAATVLRRAADSVFNVIENPNILIMGDFNDVPSCESLSAILKATSDTAMLAQNGFYNLMGKLQHLPATGTYKYKGEWSIIDQMLVSKVLISNKKLQVAGKRTYIFAPNFLLEDDPSYPGKKPFRTNIGPVYHGGFSDHLPVFTDILY